MRSEGAFLLGWLGTLYTGGWVSEGGNQMQTGQVQTVGDIVDVEEARETARVEQGSSADIGMD